VIQRGRLVIDLDQTVIDLDQTGIDLDRLVIDLDRSGFRLARTCCDSSGSTSDRANRRSASAKSGSPVDR